MNVCRGLLLLVLSTVAAGELGCNREQDIVRDGPFGKPEHCPLLAAMAGDWVFETEKTFEAMKKAGVSDADLEETRKYYSEIYKRNMHPDLTFTGNEAVGSEVRGKGRRISEYRLFALHPHDGKVCGKAWYHADRFDPGDMSKSYVRLKIVDNDLYFEVRMQDGLGDLKDPDLNASPTQVDSSAGCDIDHPAGEDWEEWRVYVFSRKP